MDQFAIRTGLVGGDPSRRYLWTDAFAVRNFIALRHATALARWDELASTLVARVHEVLAPHRDPEHPTASGLRIGKKLPERSIDAPYDEQLEWDRDGQYFHYLTQWMNALAAFARETDRRSYATYACELARVAHRAFVYPASGGKRMYWKMSIELDRPLVTSMGQHDALDGYVTFTRLSCVGIDDAIADFRAMIDPTALATSDPLGVGGLLVAASQLTRERSLYDAVIAAAVHGLMAYSREDLAAAAEHRLAFRELGLAIGLGAIGSAGELHDYLPIRDRLEAFWRDPVHRANPTWREHEDINDVMLATLLLGST
jgi:hypothetical protein